MASSKVISLCLAVALPAATLACLEAGMLIVAGATGGNPRAPIVTLNLSEATAVRDGAEMVRQLERGENPDARHPVREGLLEGRAVDATPIEAAISIRRSELIDLLYANGATTDTATWTRLTCYARRQELDEVLMSLEAHAPAGVEAACVGTETLYGANSPIK